MLDVLSRRGAVIVMFLATVVIGHPVIWASGLVKPDRNRDSFPLSTYPMFASRVPDVYGVHHIIATGPDGVEVRVPRGYWARGGMNQSRGQLNAAVREASRGDKSKLRKFCRKAAKKVATRKGKAARRYEGTTRIQIVSSRYHLKNYFAGVEKEPRRRWVRYSCPIERDGKKRKTPEGETERSEP